MSMKFITMSAAPLPVRVISWVIVSLVWAGLFGLISEYGLRDLLINVWCGASGFND